MDTEPTIFKWRMIWRMGWLWPCVLLLPLFMLRPNRRREAWLIWLPLGAILLVGSLLGTVLPEFIIDDGNPLTAPSVGLTVGLAALWLVSYRMTGWHRVLSCFAASLLLQVYALVTSLCMGSGIEMLIFETVVSAISAVAIVLAILGACLFCRRRYSPVRFAAWLFPSAILAALLICSPFAIFGMIATVSFGGPGALRGVMLAFSLTGLIAGLVFAGMLLPFLLLTHHSAFYRKRIAGMLRIQGMQEDDPTQRLCQKFNENNEDEMKRGIGGR